MTNFTNTPNPSQDALDSANEQRILRQKSFDADPFIGYDSLEESAKDCKCSSQAEVISRLLNRENLFISGPAGSGKTFVINRFAQMLDAEYFGKVNVALTASTGIASQLIGGRTIHSWSGMGISTEEFSRTNISRGEWAAKERIVNTDVLIIDEVSMLPAYLFSRLDSLMKHFRRNKKPFGGVQLVVMGDFMQLPPVDKGDPAIDSRYAIYTDAWKSANINYTYMDKARRATDDRLKHVLLQMSKGAMDSQAREYVESRVNTKLDPKKTYATLFTTNKNVDAFNFQKLNENPNPETVYNLRPSGDPKHFDKIIKTYGLDDKLRLKVGATVIVTSNIDPEMPNGTVAVIEKLTKDNIFVKLNNGSQRAITLKEYAHNEKIEMIDADGNEKTIEVPLASIEQMPLRLGYAISVHKSQGQTFDGVMTDLSKCFQPGLGYVALSRVKDLDDLVITNIKENAYKVDPKSMKISQFVKKKAFLKRKEMLANPEEYSSLLTNQLSRDTMWIDVIEDREEKI